MTSPADRETDQVEAAGQLPDYSFMRRPRWLVSHLLVGALIVVMIGAGVWQIDRHRSRAERNDVIELRLSEPPIELSQLAPAGTGPDIGEREQFRQVVVRGEYQPSDEVLIRNRTLDGAPGWWVLTPLVTSDGWAVAVNRGWIPKAFEADAPRPGTEPPSGVVEVVGSIQPARTAEGFQVPDPETGQLSTLGRPDVARLAAQVDYPMSPVVLRLDPAGVAQGTQPVPLPIPTLDAGPHVSYAGQWFVFSTIALVGYPLVVRRVARGMGASTPDDTDRE